MGSKITFDEFVIEFRRLQFSRSYTPYYSIKRIHFRVNSIGHVNGLKATKNHPSQGHSNSYASFKGFSSMQRCDLQLKLHAPHKGWQFYFRRGTTTTCMNCLFAKQTKIKPLSESFVQCMLLNVIRKYVCGNRSLLPAVAFKMTHVLMVRLII